MRAEVQALPRQHPKRPGIDLHEPARVVSDPDGTVSEGDALRASEAGDGPDDLIGRWIDLRHRTALVALIIVPRPDEAGTKGHDRSRARVETDHPSVELSHPD